MRNKLHIILATGAAAVIAASCSVSKMTGKMTYPVTIDCDQVKTAKIVALENMLGMTLKTIDVTFPYNDRINPVKGAVIKFKAPGYNDYSLVIPPNTDQSHFKIHFTENPKEMAKLRRYDTDPTIPEEQAEQAISRDNPGQTDLEKTIIRWAIDSEPRGARIFYRVISSIPAEVKNTNETYLMTTPYEETRAFNILDLTYENSRNVTVEFKVTKAGYEDQVKRFNVRQAIDQQEISTFFELVPKQE